MLEAARELLDIRLRIKSCAASVCSVFPMSCMRASREGTQVKMTLPVPGVHEAELDGGHLENSEGLLEKLGLIYTGAQKDRQADQNGSVSMQMLEDWNIKWRYWWLSSAVSY